MGIVSEAHEDSERAFRVHVLRPLYSSAHRAFLFLCQQPSTEARVFAHTLGRNLSRLAEHLTQDDDWALQQLAGNPDYNEDDELYSTWPAGRAKVGADDEATKLALREAFAEGFDPELAEVARALTKRLGIRLEQIYNARLEHREITLAPGRATSLRFLPQRPFQFGCVLVVNPPDSNAVGLRSVKVGNEEQLVSAVHPWTGPLTLALLEPGPARGATLPTVEVGAELSFEISNITSSPFLVSVHVFGNYPR
jgi:hypothetical protein